MRKTIFIFLNLIALVLTIIWFFDKYEWEPAAGIAICLVNLIDNIVDKRRDDFMYQKNQLQMKKLLARIEKEINNVEKLNTPETDRQYNSLNHKKAVEVDSLQLIIQDLEEFKNSNLFYHLPEETIQHAKNKDYKRLLVKLKKIKNKLKNNINS